MNALLESLARRSPGDVVLDDGAQCVTAGQLLVRVEALGADLTRTGVTRLALLAGNSPAWIMADLACQAKAICLLPLPVFFSDTQLLHSLQSVGIDAVLTDDPQRVISVQGGQPVASDDTAGGLTLLRFGPADKPVLPRGTQKITFTSGSTGAPRGVCLGIDQQMRVAGSLHHALALDAPRHLCLLPLSTLLENVGGVYCPLLAGGTVFSPPETATGFSGSTGLDLPQLIRAIDGCQPTSIILLPQMLVGLVAALEAGWAPPASLQFAAVGGARVAAGLLRRAQALGFPVYEGYGLSETGSVACLNRPGHDRVGTVGQPLAHVDVSIDAGEVIIAGNSCLGYVGDPASWGMQRIATGDLGEMDDAGYLRIHGRRKNVLISSFGRNISPEWVESELLVHRQIAQCVVFGDDRPYCTALILPSDAMLTDAAIQALIDSVNTRLPEYACVQRWHRLRQPLDRASGLYTDNGRPRRAAIASRFGPVIDAMYLEPESA